MNCFSCSDPLHAAQCFFCDSCMETHRTIDCKDKMTCQLCAVQDCPSMELSHYHPNGCPVCANNNNDTASASVKTAIPLG